LGERATRAQKARLMQARRRLDGLARELELISYRKVLERGFALVRGEDGSVRRAAAQVKAGESLRLTFADGEARAMATEGGAKPKPAPKKKQGVEQDSLF
jgi:exodeoxyribonuclease VII large subunit